MVCSSLFTAGQQDPMINNKKWFMNLSSTDIPKDIINFLQLGENFSLSINNRTNVKIEFIKNFENSIMRLPSDKRTTIRNRSLNILNSLSSFQIPHSNLYDNLRQAYNKSNVFLRENPNIIITRADKVNITVADKDKYINTVESMLKDEKTDTLIKRDPINKLISNLHDLLIRWKNKGFITTTKYLSSLMRDFSQEHTVFLSQLSLQTYSFLYQQFTIQHCSIFT